MRRSSRKRCNRSSVGSPLTNLIATRWSNSPYDPLGQVDPGPLPHLTQLPHDAIHANRGADDDRPRRELISASAMPGPIRPAFP
jgi:hypothetical protein